TGEVSLTQLREIDHSLPGSNANYEAQEISLNTGLVGLTGQATITDGDGDTSTDSKVLDLGGNVVFDDDGPSISVTATDGNLILLNTQDAQTIGAASDVATASFAAAFTA
ncbi:DUF5801 repeats-in-toxin domain-containing protein, partial [Legionella donaldsonii]